MVSTAIVQSAAGVGLSILSLYRCLHMQGRGSSRSAKGRGRATLSSGKCRDDMAARDSSLRDKERVSGLLREVRPDQNSRDAKEIQDRRDRIRDRTSLQNLFSIAGSRKGVTRARPVGSSMLGRVFCIPFRTKTNNKESRKCCRGWGENWFKS